MEIMRGRRCEDGPYEYAVEGELLEGTLLRIVEIPGEYPAGQSPAERVKAILDAAGFGDARPS